MTRFIRKVGLAAVVGAAVLAGSSASVHAQGYYTRPHCTPSYAYRPVVVVPSYGVGLTVGRVPSYGYGYNYGYSSYRAIPAYGVGSIPSASWGGAFPPGASWGGGGFPSGASWGGGGFPPGASWGGGRGMSLYIGR